MRLTHLRLFLLLCVPAIGVAQTGYWQYVKTDSYIYPYSAGTAYPDTHTGGEGSLEVTIFEPSLNPAPTLGVSYYWSRPPAILVPGTALYWPISAVVDKNITGRNLGISFAAMMYPYLPVSDLTTNPGWASTTYATLNTDSTMAVGTTLSYNNALQPSPAKIPPGTSTWMDVNGQMTILTWVRGASTYFWSYVYQWVPGPNKGTCGGACTLGAPGQNVGVSGANGSLTLTATSTWDVIAVDSWIKVTSSPNGTGNTSVTFTVSANTGGSRTGTIIIGGQPYTIAQDGTGNTTGTGTGSGGLGSTNIALNKPVTVNSKYPTFQGTASSITDGSFASNWFAYQGAPSYCSIVVDLGQTYSLGKIEVEPLQTFDYQLYGSTDGVTYTSIASQTWPVFITQPVSVAVNGASSARYIKYEAHTPWAQYIGLGGLRVYQWLSAAPAPQPASAYGTTDLAKGRPVQNAPGGYTSDSKNPPSNLVDGSTSTAWYGTNSTYDKSASPYDFTSTAGMVQIDLGQTYKIGKVVITPAQAQAFGVFLTSTSASPAPGNSAFYFSAYQTMFATASFSSVPQTYLVDGSVSARYVWLVAWNTAPGATPAYPGIGEIEVYEFGGGPSGTGTGTTSTSSGTCSLAAPGQPIGANGGTGSVSVTAATGTNWTAVADDSWIQLTSPATNTGSANVTFTVAANTGGPRTGTIGIAGVTYTIYQNGTATGTTSGCSYLIQSNTTQTAPPGGTSNGFIQVITAQGCSWTSSTSASWITINSGAGATGNGAVSYAVAANTSTSARSGAIVIAGQEVVVNQAGAPGTTPGGPAITAGGVVNTANYASGSAPGSLAQGSFFSIYGTSLGPDQYAQATTYPLPKTLGGVSVQITQGSGQYDAYLVFASKGQINAILPSNVPVGSALVVVNYNGQSSAPSTIAVSKTNVGVFYQQVNGQNMAIAQNVNSATDYPLNLPGVPAKPGQIVILWGTGMGAIGGADNSAPGAGDMTNVPVAITVGGVTAQRLYAGRQPDTAAVDNIYFTVPSGVPFGCQVPVAITAGGLPANTTAIAISADGSPCK